MGSASPILLYNQVDVGVVPLSLHRPLNCMEGMLVSRQMHRHSPGLVGTALLLCWVSGSLLDLRVNAGMAVGVSCGSKLWGIFFSLLGSL